ncbi:MAG: DUF2147 domain-containing protein [Salipiger thiooxidans]|uniref:DUF2147 domain-containing protein n=1 Tax=Salipiger thiooxidans TaxID=282683 RepID=UPI001A9031D0|nr:DUF2147 domain-containing protein [Salipiger thiooxidans]MBN8187673.1 DUF2147 domain-containing protein [Salipiger thiooxidans]MBR9838663.1 DUF2147 domain-containing protein [Paracoccaceae bacterium]MCA0848855.1 DUF2147 domain-containing protein [Salipiger thiooxidans]
MKKVTAMACGLALMAGAALADPVEGVWKTQGDDNGNYALVSIAPCGSEICGTLGKGFDRAGSEIRSPNIGRQMIWGMKPKGGGSYGGGKIWAPDRDKTYNSRMQLTGNSLKVEGCVLGICRGQVWTRVR